MGIWALPTCLSAGAAEVVYHPAGKPDPALVATIEEAVWSWTERAGLDIKFVGSGPDTGHHIGRISIRRATVDEWIAIGKDPTSSTARTSRTRYPGGDYYLILMGPNANGLGLLKHELGHALGFFEHTHDITSLMNALVFEQMITAKDVELVVANTDVPARTTPSLCYAEYDSAFSVFIPSIDGHDVSLRSWDGGTTFEIRNISHTATPHCEGQHTIDLDGRVVLRDVRGWQESFEEVELRQVNAWQWKLYRVE